MIDLIQPRTNPIYGNASSSKPLRVLIVMPLAEQRGGGELMLLQLLEHGRNGGVIWIVAFLADGPMVEQARQLGIEAIVINSGRLRHVHRFIRTVWTLCREVRTRRIDIVFSWMGKGQLYGGSAASLAGVPSAWYQLGLPSPAGWQDWLATRIPNRGALTCSAAATDAQSILRPVRPTRTVHPGVDLHRFDASMLPSPSACREKLGLPATGPLIGFVGRLQRWKGVHLLIDAMPGVLAAHPDAHCVIVGGDHAPEPDYPAFLSERIRALDLGGRVTLAGLQSNVPEWMNAMDVIVHASDAEPFGIVVIEAMALGKPTLATATAGPLEIITDGIDGLLWPPRDVGALTRAVLRYLDDPTFAARVGERAKRRATSFAVARYAEQVGQEIRQFERDASNLTAQKTSESTQRSRSLRVTLVMPLALRRGGCETQLMNLLIANNNMTAQDRVDYSICFLEHGPMVDDVRGLGYRAHVIDAGRLRHGRRFAAAVLELAGQLRKSRATHVVSWMEKAHFYASPAAEMVGIPAAWWLRSIDPDGYTLGLINRLPAAHVFSCSHAALAALREMTTPLRSASVCYSSVDLARFDPHRLPSTRDAKRAVGLAGDRPVVGIVARLQRWKGIDVFIDAAAHVLATRGADEPIPFFVIIGGEHALEPGVRDELTAAVERLGLLNDVLLAGFQSDVPLWMQACDIIVHASTSPEPLGIVVVEGMALEKTVIATRLGGPREIIDDGVNGYLVPPADPAALAVAIHKSLTIDERSRTIGRAARARAGDFDARHLAVRLAATLSSLDNEQAKVSSCQA